jgi:transcriptional regulator with XRE-family HTH domain
MPRKGKAETGIPDAVKSLRLALGGVSQQQLAVLLGLSVTAVARYEIGMRVPDGRVLAQLFALAKKTKRSDLAITFQAEFLREWDSNCQVLP